MFTIQSAVEISKKEAEAQDYNGISSNKHNEL